MTASEPKTAEVNTTGNTFDAAHAWDMGYHYAVRGISRICPAGTWIYKFKRDFFEGYDAATHDGCWGSHPDCRG